MDRCDFLKLAGTFLLSLSRIPTLDFEPTGVNQAGDGYPNIFILVLDALSAHHMSLYGYPRQTTPNISRFANRAKVYHRHYAAGSSTTSGTTSLLTRVYPWSHRTLHSCGKAKAEYANKNLFAATPADFYKLAYTQNNLVTQLFDHFRSHIDRLKSHRNRTNARLPGRETFLE